MLLCSVMFKDNKAKLYKFFLEKTGSLENLSNNKPFGACSDAGVLLPSGRCYSAPLSKTNKYAKSFIISAIRLLNAVET